MKYLLVAFIAFAVTAAQAELPIPEPVPDLGVFVPSPVGLGDLLEGVVKPLVKSIIDYLVNVILSLIDGSIPVSVPALISALGALPDATLGSVLIVNFAAVGVDASPVVASLPLGFANILIIIGDVLAALQAALPPNAECADFGLLEIVLGDYLTTYLVGLLTAILNGLASIA